MPEGFIPYGRQDIDAADIAAVVEVLKSDWLTQGPAIERFEQALAAGCGSRHAVAVSNATAGLHLACLAAGLGEGGRLWTSPNSFVASANCGRYCGAEVDFVDIESDTANMSADALEAKLARAAKEGRLPKVVVPVHFGGQSCDMARIGDLAQRYGFTVIEDASHAVGGRYRGERVGNCRHSAMTVFSFHPVKLVTTGEGGAILTNSGELQQKLARLRSHGITRDAGLMTGASEGGWYYQQLDLGYNSRITDIQAALGWSQLRRLDGFVARRRALAARYRTLLADLPVTPLAQRTDGDSAWHLFVIRLERDGRPAADRHRVFDRMRHAGIGVNVHYIPIHRQPYYQGLGYRAGDFPAAEDYYRVALSLPLYPGLREEDQDRVVATLAGSLRECA